jgi:hypothetical protein
LKVGTIIFPGYEFLFLARELDLFKPEEVRLVELLSSSDNVRLMEESRLDVATLTVDEVMATRAKGVDLRIVAVLTVSAGADAVMARAGLSRPEQLRGRRVGAEDGAMGAVLLDAVLQAGALRAEDVVKVPITADQGVMMFQAEKVDAVVTFEPWVTQLEALGAVRIYDSTRVPDRIVDVLAVRSDQAAAFMPTLRYVLDAQFFGVPQRRRRVFVVGCLGDWRSAAAVLFERESLLRNTSKGKSKKQEVARTLRGRAHSSHREDSDNFVAHACLAKGGTGRHDPSCETFIPTIPGALRCHDGGHAAIAIGSRPEGDDGRGYSRPEHMSHVAGTVDATKPERVLADMQVRRLTPRECERLQGFPDDWTAIRYRGKPACDGPRYKAIGNSMAVPVIRWIGERLALVD